MTGAGEPKTGVRGMSTTAWAVLTAVVALAGSLVSLAFTLVPALKPDPLDQVGAALSVFAVEPNERIDTWAKHVYGDAWRKQLAELLDVSRLEPDQLRGRGIVIYVQTQVDGYKHRSVDLTWSVHKASTGSTLDYTQLTGDAISRPHLNIDAPNRRSVQLLFIPSLQKQPLPVFVRVELVDGHETLAVTDTPVLVNGLAQKGPAARASAE